MCSGSSLTTCDVTGTPVTAPCPPRPGATATCSAGACAYTCAAGYADCDDNPANGCESLSSGAHCGACGTYCPAGSGAVATCVAGACALTCSAGYADCDRATTNGCEADLNSTANCGRCGVRCATGEMCVGGRCATGAPSTATLITGLGGTTGYGANCLASTDDGSWTGSSAAGGVPAAIPLAPAFPMGLVYGGAAYTTFYVNNNGNISFRGVLGTFTPSPFPVAMQPIIAPWWADVDTRGAGQPTRNNVCFAVEASRIVVTWHLVGFFSSHDTLQNSFQLVLTRPSTTSAPTDFDVEFRYNRCQWTTGDASGGTGGFGGTPAQAGFDFGDLRTYVALPYGRTMSILNLCTTSNVGDPGVWRFRVRDGAVLPI